LYDNEFKNCFIDEKNKKRDLKVRRILSRSLNFERNRASLDHRLRKNKTKNEENI